VSELRSTTRSTQHVSTLDVVLVLSEPINTGPLKNNEQLVLYVMYVERTRGFSGRDFTVGSTDLCEPNPLAYACIQRFIVIALLEWLKLKVVYVNYRRKSFRHHELASIRDVSARLVA